MFYSSIHANADLSIYPSAVRKAVTYLKETDFSRMEPGRYEIDGDNFYALLMDIETAPVEKKRLESHKEYLDVQFVFSGREKQGFAAGCGQAEVIESKPEKDICFYAPYEGESFLILSAGGYSVYFPDDLHRPGCAVEGPEKVRKVVVKIKMSALYD